VLLEAPARVRIVDVDPDGEQLIAELDLPDPQACQPCSFDMPGGRLELRVDVVERSAYLGPYRGSTGALPPPTHRSPAPGNPLPVGMSAAQVNSSLADLRDRDNCVGTDRVFPSGTLLLRQQALLQGPRFSRYYQMAAFAAAIPDTRVQQLVLQHIQSRLGEDYEGIFRPLIWQDVEYSRQLTAAFVDTTDLVVRMLVSKGLDRLVPSAARERLGDYLRRWMMDHESAPLTRDLVNAMYDFDISAECAMNELAKQAFTRVAAR
jgi:hypothetical protein